MRYSPLPKTRILDILAETKTIALVGASAKPERPSWRVMQFLLGAGYTVLPINPGLAGKTILDQPVHADLEALAQPVEMVDVFRSADACPALARQAVAIGAKTLWLQEGIISEEAATIAAKGGLDVVMDRCTKRDIEANPERFSTVS